MDNYKLLKKYKIKLSLFFAVFVMITFYIIQIIFLSIQYISNNLNLEKDLKNKLFGITNIIKNKDFYGTEIEKQNSTLEKIILKTLDKTNIYKNNQKIISFLDKEPENKSIGIQNILDKKYLISNINIDKDFYTIISYEYNSYNFENFIKELLFFVLISLPFFLIFYLLGYFFVNKNFKIIEETIVSLEDFTANVNHEMKTPLSEIISTLSLANKLENYKEANKIALNSAYNLTKILDTIIGMANLSNISYRKEKVDLIYEIKNIILDYNKYLQDKNIKLDLNLEQNYYFLKINKEHFDMCFRNILSNAIKYSDDFGKIEIYFNKGILCIKDYGIGIDKTNLKNIFNRFFRESYTQKQGFGLGLALVKKVCDINGWKIEVESEKNSFTKFSINFI